jgi:hypothetical protein
MMGMPATNNIGDQKFKKNTHTHKTEEQLFIVKTVNKSDGTTDSAARRYEHDARPYR